MFPPREISSMRDSTFRRGDDSRSQTTAKQKLKVCNLSLCRTTSEDQKAPERQPNTRNVPRVGVVVFFFFLIERFHGQELFELTWMRSPSSPQKMEN